MYEKNIKIQTNEKCINQNKLIGVCKTFHNIQSMKETFYKKRAIIFKIMTINFQHLPRNETFSCKNLTKHEIWRTHQPI